MNLNRLRTYRVGIRRDVAIVSALLLAAIALCAVCGDASAAKSVVSTFKVSVEVDEDTRDGKPALVIRRITLSGKGLDRTTPSVKCDQRSCKRLAGGGKFRKRTTTRSVVFTNVNWILTSRETLTVAVNRRGRVGRYVQLALSRSSSNSVRVKRSGCLRRNFVRQRCPKRTRPGDRSVATATSCPVKPGGSIDAGTQAEFESVLLLGSFVSRCPGDVVHVWAGGINTMVGNGDGSFAMASEAWLPKAGYQTQPTATTWLAGDVNGDGRSDLLHIWNAGINTLLSKGDGTYSLVREGWLPRAGYGPQPTATRWLTADANGDAKSDLIHIWNSGINMLLSNGDGTYSLVREGWLPRDGFGPQPTTTRWLAPDLNGDGKSDLTQIWNSGINTMVSSGDGRFTLMREGWLPRPGFGPQPSSTRWLTSDVNGDGRGDLSQIWSSGINTLVSNGDGTFGLQREGWLPRTSYVTNPTGTRWLSADTNADNKADLTHAWTGGLNTLSGTGDGTYTILREGWLPRAGYPIR